MKTSVPCPQCEVPITLDDFEAFSTPFTMKCPHCRVKLKETRVTPFLLLICALMIPLFIYLSELVQSLLSGFIPVVEKIPLIIIFFCVLYPVFALYERFNGLVMFNKGNLHLKHSYNEFWKWFFEHSDEYFHLNEENLEAAFPTIEKQLLKINPALTFEFSVDLIDGKREFIISADGNLDAFPAVEKLAMAAPVMENFKVIAFRQREEASDIQIGDVYLKPENMFFTYTRLDGLLDLDIYLKDSATNDDDCLTAAFILLDAIVGEYDLAVKVGDIEFRPYEEGIFLQPISKLPGLIDQISSEKRSLV
ncbi:hypothetical protein [Lederbergia citrea]|uniref:Uncharacterized protein n=1 Tax=Lederbergia citrea TaxID=2833581 RepID=A0A942Z2V8_9BACI|nr:hypothetical protein [Lederbergia citrea]MBS4221879.1 hypothetical protein [Lederbergia citrea]